MSPQQRGPHKKQVRLEIKMIKIKIIAVINVNKASENRSFRQCLFYLSALQFWHSDLDPDFLGCTKNQWDNSMRKAFLFVKNNFLELFQMIMINNWLISEDLKCTNYLRNVFFQFWSVLGTSLNQCFSIPTIYRGRIKQSV